MEEVKKEVSFKLNVDAPKTFETFFIRSDEDGLEIHFANKTEDEKLTVFTIEDIVRIPKEQMTFFVFTALDSIVDYENKYKNGYGLKLSRKSFDKKPKGKK